MSEQAETLPNLRLFLAIGPPPELRRLLGERLEPLKGELPRASWVQPENLHLTVRFLGDRPESDVERLESALRGVVEPQARIEAAVGEVGAFPSPKRPRVVFVGLKDAAEPGPRGIEALRSLAEQVEVCVTAVLRVKREKRFHPHLTLARCRSPWPRGAVEKLKEPLADLRGEAFPIDGIDLMASELGAGADRGPRYRSLLHWSLAGASS